MKKWPVKLLLAVSGLLIAASAGARWGMENVLPYMPIKPHRTSKATVGWQLPRGTQPENYGLKPEPFTVRTKDGLQLKALYFPADTASLTTLILVHGIGGCKEHFLPTAERLTKQGLNIVLFDQRAHGESEGVYCTFGYNERYDIATILDTLLRRKPGLRCGILGNSLGGAVALQALAIEPRLQFGIIESTFHDLQAVVTEYGEDVLGIHSSWLARQTLQRSAAIAYFPALEIRPYEAARKIRQPVFMSHGDQDDKIPIAFGKQNFDNLASKHKIWYPVRGANHFRLWDTGGPAYFEAMMGFIGRVEG
jgi:pimeloyl-ACP methyl ester carboxylesterase